MRGLGKYFVQITSGSKPYAQSRMLDSAYTYRGPAIEAGQECIRQMRQDFPDLPVKASVFVKIAEYTHKDVEKIDKRAH